MAAVLYVDDEPTIRRAVQLWLARYGITVHTAAGVADAQRAVEEQALDGVFVDVWLEDGSGFQLLDWLRREHPALARRVVFVTGDIAGGAAVGRRLLATGCRTLTKPFDLEELKSVAEAWVRGRDDGGEARRPHASA